MSDKKLCPFKFCINRYGVNVHCDEAKCAWWCDWANCCAMVAVPAEISEQIPHINLVCNEKRDWDDCEWMNDD